MSSSSLEVPRRPRPAKRTKLWRVIAILGALALAIGWLVWFLRTPDELPTTTRSVEGVGVVDQELYIGVFAVGDDFDRTIEISEIDVEVEADGEVEVTPQLCRGGSLSVTTDASGWCPELADPEGAEFSDGDSIVLVVTAAEPTEVTIGQLEIAFREGIRWGTAPAGLEGVELTFADHTPGVVEEQPEDAPTERPGENDDEKRDDKSDRKKNRDGDNA